MMRISWLPKPTRLFPATVVLAALVFAGPVYGEPDKPIIAHMLAAPQSYNTRTVTIYGLVIETEQDGRAFMLQDVSQMPLKIVRTDGVATAVGDQLLVKGVFATGTDGPRLNAIKIEETKVLGGGGCC